MADTFISISRPVTLDESTITGNSSTTAGDEIELRMTTGTIVQRDVLLALEAFTKFILNDGVDGSGYVDSGLSVPLPGKA